MTQVGSLESFRMGLVTRKTNRLEFGTSSTLCGSMVKNPPANAKDGDSIPGW